MGISFDTLKFAEGSFIRKDMVYWMHQWAKFSQVNTAPVFPLQVPGLDKDPSLPLFNRGLSHRSDQTAPEMSGSRQLARSLKL